MIGLNARNGQPVIRERMRGKRWNKTDISGWEYSSFARTVYYRVKCQDGTACQWRVDEGGEVE